MTNGTLLCPHHCLPPPGAEWLHDSVTGGANHLHTLGSPFPPACKLITHLCLQQVRMLLCCCCVFCFFSLPAPFSILPSQSSVGSGRMCSFVAPIERLGSQSGLGDVCWNFQLSIQVTSHWEHANKAILALFFPVLCFIVAQFSSADFNRHLDCLRKF